MNFVRHARTPVPVAGGADVIVLGSGAAGLATALALAPRAVALITKTRKLASGSTALAQGGIAVALAANDSTQEHAADTVAAGAGLSDPAGAEILTREGVARVQELIAAGMPFDREADGRPALGREAAHRHHRILHAGGDATGRLLQQMLAERVDRAPSISVVTDAFAWDVIVEDGQVRGVLVHEAGRGWRVHMAAHVVLATGGSGQLYSVTTNPAAATADGIAMAARAGATLADLEFVQFHPTALADPNLATDAAYPLLTEALRGEGARLVDAEGRPVTAHHPDGDLAPRDVVARAVWRHIANGQPVYLDARQVFARSDAPSHFPTVAAICQAAGFDPSQALLPVVPAAHYHMGGVATDDCGKTSLHGLWACGEVAATGVHGANRLASNSLLEALVFAHRVATDIAAAKDRSFAPPSVETPVLPAESAIPAIDAQKLALRNIMYEQVGLVRARGELDAATAALADGLAGMQALPARLAHATVSHDFVRRLGETQNLLLAGLLVAQAACQREESRGAHLRSDFPTAIPAWARHSRSTFTDRQESLIHAAQ